MAEGKAVFFLGSDPIELDQILIGHLADNRFDFFQPRGLILFCVSDDPRCTEACFSTHDDHIPLLKLKVLGIEDIRGRYGIESHTYESFCFFCRFHQYHVSNHTSYFSSASFTEVAHLGYLCDKRQGKSILNGGSMTLWEFFIKGGPVMWPLFACSIIALAIIIERLFTLRQSKIVPKELIEEVELLIRMGRLNDIEQLLKRSSSPLCPIIMTAIKNAGRRREIIKEFMEEAGATQAYTMERYIDILGIIAAISPLLGFLGTATGILATFKAISTMGNNSSQLLATGISEALITTVVGLAIAIPVYVCYRVLIARSDYLLIDMEMTSARILEYLKGETHEVQAE